MTDALIGMQEGDTMCSDISYHWVVVGLIVELLVTNVSSWSTSIIRVGEKVLLEAL